MARLRALCHNDTADNWSWSTIRADSPSRTSGVRLTLPAAHLIIELTHDDAVELTNRIADRLDDHLVDDVPLPA